MKLLRPYVPFLYRELAQKLGKQRADAFVRNFGGGEIYIPVHDTGKLARKITDLIGAEGLKFLQHLYGAERGTTKIMVPKAHFSELAESRAQIIELLKAGAPTSKIVRKVGCSSRTVSRYRAALRSEARRT